MGRTLAPSGREAVERGERAESRRGRASRARAGRGRRRRQVDRPARDAAAAARSAPRRTRPSPLPGRARRRALGRGATGFGAQAAAAVRVPAAEGAADAARDRDERRRLRALRRARFTSTPCGSRPSSRRRSRHVARRTPHVRRMLAVRALGLWRGRAFGDLAYDVVVAGRGGATRGAPPRRDRGAVPGGARPWPSRRGRGRARRVRGGEPLREGAQELAMLALYRCGRQSDALAHYRARAQSSTSSAWSQVASLRSLQQRILRHDPGLEVRGGERPTGCRAPCRPRQRSSGREREVTELVESARAPRRAPRRADRRRRERQDAPRARGGSPGGDVVRERCGARRARAAPRSGARRPDDPREPRQRPRVG